MSTQFFDFYKEIPEIQFDNGTLLAFTGLEGRVSQRVEMFGGLRNARLPAEEDTSQAFRKALDELGIIQQETLTVEPQPMRFGLWRGQLEGQVSIRPQPQENAVQVVLYQDEAGGMSWHFPDSFFQNDRHFRSQQSVFTIPLRTVTAQQTMTDTVRPAYFRGPITVWGRKVFKILAIPLLAEVLEKPLAWIVAKVEHAYRHNRIRLLSVANYHKDELLEFDDWASLDGKRALLVVHGIFSSIKGMLSLLPEEAMQALYDQYGGRVIALDHWTVTASPEDNARFFLDKAKQALPKGDIEFDILCHSRGGIVSRTLVERGHFLVRHNPCRFRKVYFVATPNQGSLLADPEHIVDMLDLFTNFLTHLPDGTTVYSIEIFLAIIKLLAYTGGQPDCLPGLAAMGTQGYIAQVLNDSAAPHKAAYACSAADYDPVPQAETTFFNGRFADAVIDRVFTRNGQIIPNDLVVPCEGVFAANGHPAFPIQDALVYGASEQVWHTSFFVQRRTIEHLLAFFRADGLKPAYTSLEWVSTPGAQARATELVKDLDVDKMAEDLLKERSQPQQSWTLGYRARGYVGLPTREIFRTIPKDKPTETVGDEGSDFMLPTEPKTEAIVSPIPALEVSRSPRIDFHEKVWEGEENDLIVRLDEVIGADRAEMERSLNIAFGIGESSVDILVMLAASGFDFVGQPFQTMTVHRQRKADEERVMFRLKARRPSCGQPEKREITASFILRSSCIGSVTHCTVVVPKDCDSSQGYVSGDGSSRSQGFALRPERREDCDLIIHVTGRDNQGKPPFRILLRSELSQRPYSGKDVGELDLGSNGDLTEYLQGFYQSWLDQFAQFNDPADLEGRLTALEEAFSFNLKDLGRRLWTFLPSAFQQEYYALYDTGELRSIVIHSDEMILPWELIVPRREGDTNTQPLGIRHILGRWRADLMTRPIPQHYPIRGFCVLNPNYPPPNTLPWSAAEAKALTKLFPTLVLSDPVDLIEAKSTVLCRSDIQILHFNGHGYYQAGNPDLSGLLLSHGKLQAFNFTGPLMEQAHPIVYLNACQVGSQGAVVGRMGGFPAILLENGCSGVIAPYWPVYDKRAAQFSVSLYQSLLQGRSVGEALQELRSANPQDPTYLAYSYFGDPWARIVPR